MRTPGNDREEEDLVFTCDVGSGSSGEVVGEEGWQASHVVHLLPALVILVLAMLTAPPDLANVSAAAGEGISSIAAHPPAPPP